MAQRRTNVHPDDLIFIPGGLNTGSQIIIRGRVLEQAGRFHINLSCAEDPNSDIALHFNPRNDDGDIVARNSFQDGQWQNEERDAPGFPFNNGRKFTIRIMTFPDYFRILVNNQDFVRFNHRISPSDIHYLQLSPGAEYYEAAVQNNCRAPFHGHFPGGMTIGQAVRVQGMVKDDADRFQVDFACDHDCDSVGLHFNPREDQFDVVLNSKLDGSWGQEQRGFDDFPFKRGEMFDLFFIATEGKFCVYVNEKAFTTYEYRCDPKDICHLVIEGDVELMDVAILDPLPDDFVKEIPQGLEKNDMVLVKGFFYPEGNRFKVNLIKGNSCDDDVALHVNPRRDENEVVLNSREGGDWEEEERHPLPKAMEDMVPFEMEILAKKDKFKVYTNDKKICNFRARDDIEQIKAISVAGDAYFYEVKLLRRLDEPFTDALPGALEQGNWLQITGAPDDDDERFCIDLVNGSDRSQDDIAFHFNPRFGVAEVIRNTRQGGEWGEEERSQPFFPFEQEHRFEMAYVFMPHGIRVFVNRQRFIDYNFRTDPNYISHIYLSGGCDYFEPEFF